jgi:hypothetical protein
VVVAVEEIARYEQPLQAVATKRVRVTCHQCVYWIRNRVLLIENGILWHAPIRQIQASVDAKSKSVWFL